MLPRGSADLTVLHLSDLHLTPRQTRKIDWVRSLAELKPDLVVDTGDNMADLDVLPALLHALAPLMAFPGAFVMGSNDYYAPSAKNPARYLRPDARSPHTPDQQMLPAAELAEALAAAGWRDLTNRRASIELDTGRVDLVGVDDPHLDRDRFPPPGSAAGRSATDAGAGTGTGAGAGAGAAGDRDVDDALLRLGVTHAPYTRVLDQMAADGSDLILAGHTHGGQLCVPGFGALVTNCDVDRGRAKGLHGWPGARPDEFGGQESTWLHVCAGLGTSPFTPVRFACRPEASLLTLTAR